MTAYVAPAAYLRTFLHRPGPDATPGGPDWLTGVAVDGFTVCGRPMLADELWVPVERREGDPACPACEASVGGQTAGQAAQDVQEALL